VATVWYHVRDLDLGRAFYRDLLGFTETHYDGVSRWSRLERGDTEIGLAEGEPDADAAVAHLDVDDVKAEADRLRAQGAKVGVVFELHGEMRLLDVYDPDGNRIELGQPL
jgi:predicted enzyme related to lactoylglutathione lyase